MSAPFVTPPTHGGPSPVTKGTSTHQTMGGCEGTSRPFSWPMPLPCCCTLFNRCSTIAVHCHYGFNRTGFLIVSYLVEEENWRVDDAIAAFAASRPPGIKHGHFTDELRARYRERDPARESSGGSPVHGLGRNASWRGLSRSIGASSLIIFGAAVSAFRILGPRFTASDVLRLGFLWRLLPTKQRSP
mmetsp:Transcript_26915/g.60167  ORF Transcript_26915/g.60167 Transcript_26915/m.60167 type:complete len:187 (+) Transcript_26915:488-1048(+)